MPARETDYLEAILNANVYDVAIETPLQDAPLLSRAARQPAAAEARGPAAGLLVQAPRRLQQDVAPAGGRAAARGRRRLGREPRAGRRARGAARSAPTATIVMPVTTPQIKVDSVAALGATVVLEGDSYDDAHAEAMRIVRRRKLTFVHPYDDPDVIAGQGTIAMEILRAAPRADRRDLRRRRRRRPDRGHRRLREAPPPRDPHRRRRAGRRERDGALAPSRPPDHAPARRPLRRRRRRQAGRRRAVPARAHATSTR